MNFAEARVAIMLSAGLSFARVSERPLAAGPASTANTALLAST